jgi:hypothetical protein
MTPILPVLYKAPRNSIAALSQVAQAAAICEETQEIMLMRLGEMTDRG